MVEGLRAVNAEDDLIGPTTLAVGKRHHRILAVANPAAAEEMSGQFPGLVGNAADTHDVLVIDAHFARPHLDDRFGRCRHHPGVDAMGLQSRDEVFDLGIDANVTVDIFSAHLLGGADIGGEILLLCRGGRWASSSAL